jgi:thiosulfate/3-mercaptopyruvate sulfurtransferase
MTQMPGGEHINEVISPAQSMLTWMKTSPALSFLEKPAVIRSPILKHSPIPYPVGIAYDNRGGGIAVRLWWMLKWLGHDAAAVLDGSLTHWKKVGFPVTDEITTAKPKTFKPKPHPEMIATLNEIETIRQHPNKLLVDSRAQERYRGETEPLDPVAGHIPGAVNRYYMDNLDEEGKMKTVSELKEIFSALIGETQPGNVIFYCGSGVTSAHNILAMAHAGLGMAKIYPGSWSEWVIDPDHIIETVSE